MKKLFLTSSGVLLVTLLATPTLGAGWSWDIGNGLGFAAFAGLLYLGVSGGPSLNMRAHQALGFSVLGVATAHAIWLLLIDPVVIEYLKPGAPAYIWMGIVGFLLLIVLILIGLPEYRLRLHKRYTSFRHWHRGLAIATTAGAGYHIAISGFYLNAAYQVGLFVILTVAVLWGGRRIPSGDSLTTRAPQAYLAAAALSVALFAGIRNISL